MSVSGNFPCDNRTEVMRLVRHQCGQTLLPERGRGFNLKGVQKYRECASSRNMAVEVELVVREVRELPRQQENVALPLRVKRLSNVLQRRSRYHVHSHRLH